MDSRPQEGPGDAPPLRVMVTGHRRLRHERLVRRRLDTVLTRFRSDGALYASLHPSLRAAGTAPGVPGTPSPASHRFPVVAVSGGAAGADTVWAEAAVAAGVPVEVVLPNRHYVTVYPEAVSRELLDAAAVVSYAVERPPHPTDVARAWHVGKWWKDNFARNTVMIAASDVALVVSDRHPHQLLAERRGGTVHAVRVLASSGARVVWVPDRTDRDLCWVRLG